MTISQLEIIKEFIGHEVMKTLQLANLNAYARKLLPCHHLLKNFVYII